MWKQYLSITWRKLRIQRLYSIVNLAGLTIGLVACWCICLYIYDELKYDKFYPKADRIFRLVSHQSWPKGALHLATTSAPFAAAIMQDYPEVENTTRFSTEGGGIVKVDENQVPIDGIYFTDSSVFKVFDYPLLYGNPATALSRPNTIVLTESLAVQLFGNAGHAIDQTLQIDEQELTVTGVMKDIPEQSHLKFKALRSWPVTDDPNSWLYFDIYTYLLLHEGSHLENQLSSFYPKYLAGKMEVNSFRFELQPITSIHLNSHLDYELSANGNVKTIYIFSFIAFLILIIACINYINISTAKAGVRMKEIGVRKSLGSGSLQLTQMFLLESFMVTTFAALLAIASLYFVLPSFNQLTGKNIRLDDIATNKLALAVLGFIVVVGATAGIFPALLLAKTKAIRALQEISKFKSYSSYTRKSLVVFQFSTAIILITISAIVALQMRYVNKTNLGFNKESSLVFHIQSMQVRKNIDALKTELAKASFIKSVAASSNAIGTNFLGSMGYSGQLDDGSYSPNIIANDLYVDQNFLQTLDIQLLKGRNFDLQSGDLEHGIIINETFAKKLGIKDPVGKIIRYQTDSKGTLTQRQITGVIKDFHVYSLQHSIIPLALKLPMSREMEDNIFVKFEAGHATEAIDYIKSVYKKFDSYPLDVHFVNENFAAHYKKEQQQGSVLLTFTFLAVFIACLGLFGLAAFMAEQRTKEIGVRKVLGATTYQIVWMMSIDFLKLVLIAALIAIPLAWWGGFSWLLNFAYHVKIHWWLFVLSGFLAGIIAFVTIGFQAVKSAKANPAKSLRTQ